ncbi:nicotinate-nucleotide--dimethylbenzimidazole phosphoribosyltransferase [Streptomyces sp. NPDC055078]
MTDTGQIPGEGLPENAGVVEQQPGMPGPGAYTYLPPSEQGPEEDDLLLMPGAQGAWSDPHSAPPAQHQATAPQAQPVQQTQPVQQAQPVQQTQPPAQDPAPVPPGQHPTPAHGGAMGQAPVAAPVPEQPPGPAADYQGEAVPVPAPMGPEFAAPTDLGSPELGAAPEFATPPDQGAPALGVPTDLGAPDLVAPVPGIQPGAEQTAPPVPPVPAGGTEQGPAVPPPAADGEQRAAEPVPDPAASAALSAPQAATARRPLHMGPPLPDTSGGVVLSLADRGPAGTPPHPLVMQSHPGPPTTGPEYLDVPREESAQPLPGPQLGEIPPQAGAPWDPRPPQSPAVPPVSAEAVAPAPPALPTLTPTALVAPAPAEPPAPAPEPEEVVQEPAQESVQGPVQEAAEEPVEPEEPEESGEAVREQSAEPEAPAPQATVPAPREETRAPGRPEAVTAAGPAAEPAPESEPEPEPVLVQQAADVPVTEAEADTEAGTASEAAPGPVAETEPGTEPASEPGTEPETEPESGSPAEATAEAAGHSAEQPSEPAPGPEAAAEPEPHPAPHPEQVAAPEPEAAAEPAAQQPEPAAAAGQEAEQAPEPAPEPAAEPAPAAAQNPPAPGFDEAERDAVLRVMRERRDIRNGFRGDPIPHEVLLRVLEAAHTAPSVGHSQPWDFVVIRSAETRGAMLELAQRQRDAYAKSLPKGRAKQFKELKIEAILETPVNIVVTADPTRGGRHTLGRHTQPQMAPYSSALAVENLWLAARAEGLGVGWVSFFDEREMVRALGLPEHLEVVAYLCVGYVDEFPEEPELMQSGWSKRRPLSWVVHEETYGRRALPGEEPHDLLQETVTSIRPLDAKALGEAWERQKRMTKPPGALGMLEIISAQLSGLSRLCPPPIPEPAAVAIFAGDHGVHAQGVTAWPQEVTGQMVANFLGGGAVCNAFANQVGAEVCVIDVGVAADLPATPGLLPRKVRAGTADFTTGPALTREEALSAIEVGIETARDLVAAGNKALITGEMGIANTTVSAALICVYTGMDPAEITGRGTGINDEMHTRKIDVVRRALELHTPDPADPVGVLAAVGGLEHAALVGLILGGASLRTPVLLDGVSAGAAALVARAIAPEALAACIAGHRSAEPGHVAALNKLGLRPLVDLDLRLGEGTGALLALPVVQSAARAMHEVATFDSAGVTEK